MEGEAYTLVRRTENDDLHIRTCEGDAVGTFDGLAVGAVDGATVGRVVGAPDGT